MVKQFKRQRLQPNGSSRFTCNF